MGVMSWTSGQAMQGGKGRQCREVRAGNAGRRGQAMQGGKGRQCREARASYSCLHNSRHETFHFEKKKMSCELDISVSFACNDLNLFLSYSLKNRLVHHNKTLLI